MWLWVYCDLHKTSFAGLAAFDLLFSSTCLSLHPQMAWLIFLVTSLISPFPPRITDNWPLSQYAYLENIVGSIAKIHFLHIFVWYGKKELPLVSLLT